MQPKPDLVTKVMAMTDISTSRTSKLLSVKPQAALLIETSYELHKHSAAYSCCEHDFKVVYPHIQKFAITMCQPQSERARCGGSASSSVSVKLKNARAPSHTRWWPSSWRLSGTLSLPMPNRLLAACLLMGSAAPLWTTTAERFRCQAHFPWLFVSQQVAVLPRR